MFIGLLTVPFGNQSLEHVLTFAKDSGFSAVEIDTNVGSGHIDAAAIVDGNDADVRNLINDSGLTISALGMYSNMTEADPSLRKQTMDNFRTGIDAAARLGVDRIITLPGTPLPGLNKFETIERICPEVFQPLCDHAAEKGVRIALENWYMSNLQGLEHYSCFFEAVNRKNIGLNFDPSHLVHQGIDYLYAAEHFQDRIFHVHAKDTEVNEHQRRWIGYLESGWWRYVIPGFGAIRWGEFIGTLQRVGYNDVLSIEHEDSALGIEEGFIKGRQFLSQFV